MRILIIEDEKALAEALKYILEKNHYQVDVACDGLTGESYALSNIYDGFVFDRMLPGKEGVEILKCVRKANITTPAMFLTAKDSIDDRVEGLEAGADDYLLKPFSNREFLARVNALTRRSINLIKNDTLVAGKACLNINTGIIKIENTEILLTKTECQLLELLIRNFRKVITKEQILDRIWGFDKEVELANVELYIYYLRKKIDFLQASLILQTIRGMGYCLKDV